MKVFNLLSQKNTIARLNKKIIFALMCFVMKIIWFILFMYQIKNLYGFIDDNKCKKKKISLCVY